MQPVYLDHNATSPMRAEVRDKLIETLDRVSGNPSSVHAAGRDARMVLDEARERVAGALGVLEDEILFTSGGTEADNLAIFGGMASLGPKARLVTSPIEHPAVLVPAQEHARKGYQVCNASVNSLGEICLQSLVSACLSQTGSQAPPALLAISAANSEVGSLVPLATLNAKLAESLPKTDRPLLFSDAVQALGRIPVDLRAWGVDMAAFSAHKVGGPMGVGVLFRKQGVPLEPRFFGGGQEGGLRAGTENVAAVAAASLAIELAVNEQESFQQSTGENMWMMWKELVSKVPQLVLNGPSIDSPERLPNTMNVRWPFSSGQVLITKLDLLGLQVSAGSACSSGSLEPSTVLKAMGQTDEDARSGIRLSAGRNTTKEDIHNAVEILLKTLPNVRNS